jgi:hypothetical protein
MHRIFTAAMVCLLLAACSSGGSARPVTASDVQVVAQWVLPEGGPSRSNLPAYFRAESVIDRASEGLYVEDGNDVGGGVFNVFLYTERVDDTVARLVALERSGKLPSGLRVGVARYKDPEHTDWDFIPRHPFDLKHFDLSYDRPRAPAS